MAGVSASSHPHPPPASGPQRDADVLVIGGGHAGIEAAAAAARLGARVVLVSFELDRIGEMSCNPAIGGLGKGQLVREIDALGGLMGVAADRTGIQFRMLGTGKGAAARAPRCQSDRHRYRETVTALLAAQEGVELVAGEALGLVLEEGAGGTAVAGVRLAGGRVLRAPATILTTGTFLRAVMHTGEQQARGGRIGERSSEGLAGDVARLELALGRLKTGTPPRLERGSIDYARLEEQAGDSCPRPFSYTTERRGFPRLPQVPCHLTWTNPTTHAIIRENVHLSPMYAGRIQGVGPRYCPSVEDKIVRFADRERHQVFLEPEGLESEVVYAGGVSTSLPARVQEAFVHTIEGLERARFLRHGYAVEYDFVQPSQLAPTLAVRAVPGLFLAGQINGTSGYEEAAGQGLIAGANAALWVLDREPFLLGRHEAFLGVMVDDLIVTNPSEPYRMFTSRAEYRLLLRSDNADRRLVGRGAALGLVPKERAEAVARKEETIAAVIATLDSIRPEPSRSLRDILRRPEVGLAQLEERYPALAAHGLDEELREAVEIEVKYAGYIERQAENVRRLERQERTEIPPELDYGGLVGLASEARERLERLRPRTLGAASRIAGVRPPDVALLAVHVERLRRQRARSE